MRTLQRDIAIGVLIGNFGNNNPLCNFFELNMVA
jgi:hypothetical protein